MRSSTLIFSLFCFTNSAWANFLSGGYTTLFFYYAYRLDQAASDDPTIATGCRSATSGPCNLAEFIKYIQFVKPNNDLATPNPFGVDAPDPLSAGTALTDDGGATWNYDGTYSPSKLLALPEWSDSLKPPAYVSILDEMVNTVETAISLYDDDHGSGAGAADFAHELDSMTMSVWAVQKTRMQDQMGNMMTKIQNKFPGLNIRTYTTVTPGGLTYDCFDSEDTIRATPGLSPTSAQTLSDFAETGYDASRDGRYHWNIIQAVSAFGARLTRLQGCSAPVSPT